MTPSLFEPAAFAVIDRRNDSTVATFPTLDAAQAYAALLNSHNPVRPFVVPAAHEITRETRREFEHRTGLCKLCSGEGRRWGGHVRCRACNGTGQATR